MELISIIMPVYNSKRFLEMAIKSVINQTYKNFELLLVDDGSNDGSEKICDIYGQKDNRIKVIHKENGGVCSARNLGLEYSKGAYISFIDNDDEYEKDFLLKLYNKAKETDSDIVKCGRKNIKINENMTILSEKKCTSKAKVLSYEEFAKEYYEIKRTDILSSVWNGLYKTKVINDCNLKFDENLKHGNEDIIFNSQFFLKTERIAIISDILYVHYYRLSHSTSMHFYDDQIESRIKAIKNELKIINTNNVEEEQYKMLVAEGFRECFRILQQSKSKNERKKGIRLVKKELDINVLKKLKIISNKNLTKEQKIDLFLIKYNCNSLYFILRNIRNIISKGRYKNESKK